MAICVVHAADLHLDTPFTGLGQVTAPSVARRLRDATLEAWDALVDLVLRERADLLLLAGDIYDGPQRGLRAQLRVLAGLERLGAAGVRTFIVHGDHDPPGVWSAVRRWPEGVHVFGSEHVQRVPLSGLGGVAGISPGDEPRNPWRLFRRASSGGLEFGLLHGDVDGDPAHPGCAPVSGEDLLATGLDYWALGHAHARREVHGGGPWIEYPGNLQGLGPGETGPRGALVVRGDPASGTLEPPCFVALDQVRFLHLDVDLSAAGDAALALAAVAEAARALREDHAGRGLVVGLRLVGRSAGAAELRYLGAARVLETLRAEAAVLEPPLWWDDVRIEGGTLWDRKQLEGRGDLVAEVVAQAERLRPEALSLANEAAGAVAPTARQAGLPPLEAEGAVQLLDLAEERCLDLLLQARGESS